MKWTCICIRINDMYQLFVANRNIRSLRLKHLESLCSAHSHQRIFCYSDAGIAKRNRLWWETDRHFCFLTWWNYFLCICMSRVIFRRWAGIHPRTSTNWFCGAHKWHRGYIEFYIAKRIVGSTDRKILQWKKTTILLHVRFNKFRLKE